MKWKKWGFRFLKGLGLFTLNGASWAWLVMNFIGNQEIEIDMLGVKKVIDVSFWDTLSNRYKLVVYILMIAAIVLTIWLIAKMYQHYREDHKFIREGKIKDEIERKEKLLQLKTLEKKSRTQVLSEKEMELLEELTKEMKG